jgi:hypothetical protein
MHALFLSLFSLSLCLISNLDGKRDLIFSKSLGDKVSRVEVVLKVMFSLS